MKKVIILGGSLNSSNRGVNALTRGTINMLYSYNNKLHIEVLSNSIPYDLINEVEINNHIINVKEIAYKNKKMLMVLIYQYLGSIGKRLTKGKVVRVLESLLVADLILDLSGGDSFSDIYGYKRFIENIIMKKIAIKNEKKLILLPQTLGPFKNVIVRNIAKNVIEKSSKTYARDIISYNIATKELGLDKEKVSLVPDMAFWLKAKENTEVKFDRLKNSYIGINISGLLINGGYTKNNAFQFAIDYKELCKEIIKYFIIKKDIKIILVPHVVPENLPVEDDILAAKNILDDMALTNDERIILVENKLLEDELKYIISNCDFFIGGRMHACIGAISSNVPTIPIAYSRKFMGIWEQMGMGQVVVDPKIESKEQILSKINECYLNKDKIKCELQGQLKEIYKQYSDLESEIKDNI